MVYYNEIEPYCVEWLKNLIAEKLIPYGDVDSRSIKEVQPDDFKGYKQCHFFAGIGGWPYALRLAGWPDDRQVWTGSCPCQPFSVLGRHAGFDDERHLWPEWFRFINICRPSVIFGEQVAHAKLWLDVVFSDLELCEYSCGAADIPAAGIGASHIRQRIWFVADSDKERWENAKRIATSEKKTYIGSSSRVVCRPPVGDIQWPTKPDPSWIVDGLSGEGNAVSAYGNAIVPQVAAEFIQAYLECLS